MEDKTIAKVEKPEVIEDRVPLVDIIEDKESVTLYFEVPGTNASGVNVEIDNHILSVTADSSLRCCGRPVRFKREFRLSEFAAVEKITAKTKDGVLTLVIPKSERAKVHKVKVS